jgi:hypothetical protein
MQQANLGPTCVLQHVYLWSTVLLQAGLIFPARTRRSGEKVNSSPGLELFLSCFPFITRFASWESDHERLS